MTIRTWLVGDSPTPSNANLLRRLKKIVLIMLLPIGLLLLPVLFVDQNAAVFALWATGVAVFSVGVLGAVATLRGTISRGTSRTIVLIVSLIVWGIGVWIALRLRH